MDPGIRKAVEVLHSQGRNKVSLLLSGGAAQSISWLLAVPGASSTMIEARAPYAREATADMLDVSDSIDKSVSIETSRRMALAAYRRSVMFAPRGMHACWTLTHLHTHTPRSI